MRQKQLYLKFLLFIFAMSWFTPFMVLVQAETFQQTTPIAVSLVIDQSGSMEESDPANLRQSAAEILIDLLSPGDSVGVVRFSDEAREVFPLQLTTDVNRKNELKAKLQESAGNAGATDYLLALQQAVKQLEQAPPDSQKMVLFLTDGQPEQKAVDGLPPMEPSAYLEQIKTQVQAMGEMGIPVHTIGFAASDAALLTEMATATKGEAALLNSPSEIASTFFRIVATSKRRTPVMEVDGLTVTNQELTIPVGSYTQQVTVLLTTNGSELLVESIGPAAEGVLLQNHPGYSILTVNQAKPGVNNDILLQVKTNGTATVSAARDSFFKLNLIQPEANTVKSLNEPIHMEVSLSDPLEAGMEVVAHMIKNGVPDRDTISLVGKNGNYTATYPGIDKLGSYQVLISVQKAGEVIAESASSFSVKNIPALKSDTHLGGEVFKLGDELTLSSSLETQKIRVLESNDLQISQYQLFLQKERNNFTKIALMDDPAAGTGDLLKGDGLYTGKWKFDETGEFDAFIRATGTYKGELFVQELSLGRITVSTVGTLEVALLNDRVIKNGKGIFNVPVRFTNHSAKDELVQVSVPGTTGTLMQTDWMVPAGATLEETLTVNLSDKNLETAELTFSPKDSRMMVMEGPKRVVVMAFEATLLERLFSFIQRYQLLLLIIVGLLLLFWGVGQLLNKRLVQSKKTDWQEIMYLPVGVDQYGWKVVRHEKGQKSIRIAFNSSEENVNLLLPALTGMNQGFLMEITKRVREEERFRFLEGYKALFQKKAIVLEVSVEPPGYLKYNGQLLSQLTLEAETEFEVGGYRFLCRMEPIETNEKKNLLEGKEG